MDEKEKWDREMSMAVVVEQKAGENGVVLTTAPSTGSSARASSSGFSPTAGMAAAGGSSAFGSVNGACSDSAFDYLF